MSYDLQFLPDMTPEEALTKHTELLNRSKA